LKCVRGHPCLPEQGCAHREGQDLARQLRVARHILESQGLTGTRLALDGEDLCLSVVPARRHDGGGGGRPGPGAGGRGCRRRGAHLDLHFLVHL
jgi:hypothetical protein